MIEHIKETNIASHKFFFFYIFFYPNIKSEKIHNLLDQDMPHQMVFWDYTLCIKGPKSM